MNGSVFSFSELMNRLADHDKPFPPKYLQYFSDLVEEQLSLLSKTWKDLPISRKLALLEDLDDLAEQDTLMDFTEVAKTAIRDVDEQVRETALHIFWESEDRSFVEIGLDLLGNDPSARVRASTASILGRFVFMGETDDLPPVMLNRIVDGLLEVHNKDPDKLVRRRALESLGYSSRDEINHLITQAVSNADNEWLASSLYAMGRSADQTWSKYIYKYINHSLALVREEAVRAAGELELADSRELLLSMVAEEEDEDVLAAAIWSLSQIGGEGVREAILKQLESAQDDDYSDYLENALDNLDFTEELAQFNLFDMGDEDGIS
jgi:HEAT repeat protein